MNKVLTITLVTGIILFSISCSKEMTVERKIGFVAMGDISLFEQTRTHFTVEYDSLDWGMFVKSIDGTEQSRTTYWLYYVNGEAGKVASNTFFPNPGDSIEWRLLSGY